MDIVDAKLSNPESVLDYVNQNTGLLWERINEFKKAIVLAKGVVLHHTEEMQETFPLKHHIKDGIYTREVFMPKGMLVVSYIHKTNHPSFFMSGEMSVINDKGEANRIKAPMVVQTEVGTQRIAYTHEDCVWVCTYRTDATTVEEAEKDVYTEDFQELPQYVIQKNIEVCQE
tara:strand:- start:773 stop:1288 length:516 start_codon:yes stop_codon:yes gene_type:complete